MAQNTGSTVDDCETYYQISDDDIDECDDLGEDSLLEETDGPANSSNIRGHYERAWTTGATRALIHIRGPMEGRFNEGRHKRTALWLQCTRNLQKLGYRYSAAKVQKKWHNILITYNKNLGKKYLSGHVHWEFFEEMFKYLEGKKANCESGSVGKYHQQQQQKQHQDQQQQHQDQQQQKQQQQQQRLSQQMDDTNYHRPITPDQLSLEIELKNPKLEYSDPLTLPLPLGIAHGNGYVQKLLPILKNDGAGDPKTVVENEYIDEDQSMDDHSVWWKDYFERKLRVEQEKLQLQKEMHSEQMQFNKTSLNRQEKIERMKIDAINNLTNTLQKLVETKNKKM